MYADSNKLLFFFIIPPSSLNNYTKYSLLNTKGNIHEFKSFKIQMFLMFLMSNVFVPVNTVGLHFN